MVKNIFIPITTYVNLATSRKSAIWKAQRMRIACKLFNYRWPWLNLKPDENTLFF